MGRWTDRWTGMISRDGCPTEVEMINLLIERQPVTYPVSFFGQAGTHIEPMVGAEWRNFQILEKSTPWPCLFLDLFVKHFPNYLSLRYRKLFRG